MPKLFEIIWGHRSVYAWSYAESRVLAEIAYGPIKITPALRIHWTMDLHNQAEALLRKEGKLS